MNADLTCHAARQHPPRHPCKQSTIDVRWHKAWEPWAAINSHLADDPAAQFACFKAIHAHRVVALFRVGISWRAILASDLDSPMPSSDEFTADLTLAIKRRKARIGRVKGKGKKYANQQ